MCGIAGFWHLKKNESPKELDVMLDQIVHRGPDGRGAHIDGPLHMGHTRLSIIDLATGAQPLRSPDQQIVYTGNAEFYDYKRLRCELTAGGHEFTTKSDNELAIKLYADHGLDSVQHLRGEFAFALYDRKQERMILCRDRFGIRPLYYRVEDDAVYWASEMKAMVAHPDVTPKISREAALHQLMQTQVPGMALFAGIHALLPGHMLIIEKKGDRFVVRDETYWDVDFPDMDAHRQVTDEEAVAEVRRLLIESISLRLEADVPVAAYLSGGIDSCCIFGLASALQQSPVTAFTIGFENQDFDETHIASTMTQHRGADHKILTLGADDLYGENYEKSLFHSERTFYNTLGVAKFLLSRLVHESGLKVVITGEGADELFGGYPFFKQDLAQVGGFADLIGDGSGLGAANKLFSGSMLTNDTISHPAFDELCGFTPNWIQTWIKTLGVVRPLLSENARRELGDYDPIAAIAGSLDKSRIDGRHPLNKAQYTWIKTTLEGQLLNWGGDRVDMAHSLETRPAFLDHVLAEYAFSLPPHLLIRRGREKWVLREAVKGVLPEVLYNREKFPFMAPPAHYDDKKKEALASLCKTHLATGHVEDVGILDPGAVTQLVEQYFATTDAAVATRLDVAVNHVLGLHILASQF